MNYLVTTQQMRLCDQNTSEYFGIPAEVLMERAALAAAAEAARMLRHSLGEGAYRNLHSAAHTYRTAEKSGRILVLCGSGNNGADGYAAARLLFLQGYRVRVLFCGDSQKRSGLNRMQHEIVQKYEIPCDNGKDRIAEYDIEGCDLILDAVFGIGLSRAVESGLAGLFDKINLSGIPVLALDMPSGIDSEKGAVLGCALRARRTVTFGFMKTGLALYPGAEYAGSVRVEEIGITKESFLGSLPGRYYLQENDIVRMLPKRAPGGNKGTFGKILIMAGSPDMSGACSLCALASYRAGAGMVRILTCPENSEILQKTVPEALLTVIRREMTPDEKRICIRKALQWADAAAAGCGIGLSGEAKENFEILYDLMCETYAEKPLILDADALNILAKGTDVCETLRRRKPYTTVLTPHVAELSRLCGRSVAEIKEDFLAAAEIFSEESRCILAAKDARTYIYASGRGCLNLTGNDGMATAGAGDVLTGITAAYAAAYAANEADLYEAVCMSVYLHGAAGDLAASKIGKEGVMSGDIAAALPEVVSLLREEKLNWCPLKRT